MRLIQKKNIIKAETTYLLNFGKYIPTQTELFKENVCKHNDFDYVGA